MEEKLISVLLPVYNDREHLDRSVNAVLHQTYSNIEILLIDDGSTDGSEELCDSFAERDSRVRVFHKPNGGHSSAVNYGLERLNGDYVMICDTDDWYEPDACETAFKVIEAHPETDAVIFAIYRPDKEPVEDPATMVSYEKRKIQCMLLSGLTAEYCHIGFHVEATWAKIIRSDVIKNYSIRIPEQLFLAEDAAFCLYLFEHCRNVMFDSHHIYHYEIRYDSLCRKYSNLAARMLPEILTVQDQFINEYHAEDKEYISSNNSCIFPWMNEAEEHFFFNKQQTMGKFELYNKYKECLITPVVKKHLFDISPFVIKSDLQRLRLILYKHPTYFMFSAYKKLKSRG